MHVSPRDLERLRQIGPNAVSGRPGSQQMRLVAVNLECSGIDDEDDAAILEIALVPIIDWEPDPAAAYWAQIDPFIPADADLQLARRINGRYLVGHDVDVDWRMLHRRCPGVVPAGLIDTRRLVRRLDPGYRHDLRTAVQRLGLGELITELATDTTAPCALWDTVAAGLLLATLARDTYGPDLTIGQLLHAAGVPFTAAQICPGTVPASAP